MPAGGEGRGLLIVLTVGLFLVCASLWSVSVPAFETPDEPQHAGYVNILREAYRMPVPGLEAGGQAHQPPLYYGLAGTLLRLTGLPPIRLDLTVNPAFRWFGGPEENMFRHGSAERPALSGSARSLHWLRLLSVLLGAGTVAAVFLTGAAGGVPAGTAVLAASLVAFTPQFTFISASLNNDALANLLAAGSFACLAAGLRRPDRPVLWAGAGTLAGLGLLTKFTSLTMLPCGLLAILLSSRIEGDGRPAHPARLAARAAGFLAPALLIPAPLFVRNLRLLGDPLGAAFKLESLPGLVESKPLLSPYFVTEFPAGLFRSFWGLFGWMSFRMPALFYASLLALTLAGAAGLLLMRRDRGMRRLHVLCAAAVVFQLLQVFIYNLNFTQPQGRFLFPVIGPIALLLCAGLGEIARRLGGAEPGFAGLALLVSAMAAGNLGLLRLIVVPAYHAAGAAPES